MALTLPSAPKNFYDPSLLGLKNALETVNGSTKGQFALITAAPADIESAWVEVGVAGDSANGLNRGNLVVGHIPINLISDPVLGPEESIGENGYKLVFEAIENVPIYIDGSGVTTAVVVGAALIEGVDTFAAGTNNHVRYLPKVNNLTVTDGGLINIPEFEVIINYSKIAV